MKRILTVLLVLSMLLTTAACDGTEAPAPARVTDVP